jgi:DNA-binding NtrC family response regulator
VDEFARLNLVGKSAVFSETTRLLARIARYDATTLIQGETGTGKELAARAIHYLGPRREHPFVPINCGALPDSLVESELFGYERGAFTDAKERRRGLLDEARGGTLFLDEIEGMSPRAQMVLLRFLQDQQFRPVGSTTVVTGNVRLIAASNADLAALASQHQFRRDLWFRLSVLVIRLPPLRARTGDPVLLAETFIDRFSRRYGVPPRRLSAASRRWLEEYSWPGNVRELESLILREVLLGDEDAGVEIDLARPATSGSPNAPDGMSTDRRPGRGSRPFRQAKAEAVAEFERTYLRQLLAEAQGNVSLAARWAGKDRTTLKRLLRRHGLDRIPTDDTDAAAS